MTKDAYVGIAATIAFGLLAGFVGPEWFIEVFSSNPFVTSCFALCMLSFGYCIHGIVHARAISDTKSLRERNENLVEENGKLNSEIKWLNAKLLKHGDAELDPDAERRDKLLFWINDQPDTTTRIAYIRNRIERAEDRDQLFSDLETLIKEGRLTGMTVGRPHGRGDWFYSFPCNNAERLDEDKELSPLIENTER